MRVAIYSLTNCLSFSLSLCTWRRRVTSSSSSSASLRTELRALLGLSPSVLLPLWSLSRLSPLLRCEANRSGSGISLHSLQLKHVLCSSLVPKQIGSSAHRKDPTRKLRLFLNPNPKGVLPGFAKTAKYRLSLLLLLLQSGYHSVHQQLSLMGQRRRGLLPLACICGASILGATEGFAQVGQQTCLVESMCDTLCAHLSMPVRSTALNTGSHEVAH